MRRIISNSLCPCIFLCSLSLAACSKSSSNTGDDNKPAQSQQNQLKQPNQAPTDEEARQAIKEFWEKWPLGKKDKEAEVLSLSKPMQPSPEFLAVHSGSTAYYTTVEIRAATGTINRHALVIVTRMTFGPDKGKLYVSIEMQEEQLVRKHMGEAWLREHPVPWKSSEKK